MRIILGTASLIVAFTLGKVFAVSTGTVSAPIMVSITTISKISKINLSENDRLVCGVNPSSYSGGTSLIDYTVTSGHSIEGNLSLNGRQN